MPRRLCAFLRVSAIPTAGAAKSLTLRPSAPPPTLLRPCRFTAKAGPNGYVFEGSALMRRGRRAHARASALAAAAAVLNDCQPSQMCARVFITYPFLGPWTPSVPQVGVLVLLCQQLAVVQLRSVLDSRPHAAAARGRLRGQNIRTVCRAVRLRREKAQLRPREADFGTGWRHVLFRVPPPCCGDCRAESILGAEKIQRR